MSASPAPPGCSDRTIRRRLHEWAAAGLMPRRHALVREQDDRMIGRDRDAIVGDGGITKAPGGGERAGRSPVDRGQPGRKRATLTDGPGIPRPLVSAGANRHDAPLRAPPLTGLEALLGPRPPAIAAHLDRGSDSAGPRAALAALAITGVSARQGRPAPLQGGRRWVGERTHAGMNGYGKLRRCTERRAVVVDFARCLAAAFGVTRCLIQRARQRSRWDTQPTTRRLT